MRKWVAGSILFQSVSVSVDGPNLQKLDLRCLLPKAFSRERLRKGHFVCQKQFGRDGRAAAKLVFNRTSRLSGCGTQHRST